MPEGDTIYRTARTLRLALAGRTVTAFETVFPGLDRVNHDDPLVGRRVLDVRSVGKHLLIEFDRDLLLRTHMRMSGSWHIYRPGERWYRGRSAMRIVIGTQEYVAVAFDVPVAEFLTGPAMRAHAELGRLGPDLLGDRYDAREALARLRALGGAAIADALLDQRAVAGVGNVFKSEVLFVCGLEPFRSVGSLDDRQVARVLDVARELLRANVVAPSCPTASGRRGARTTTRMMNPGAPLWVYGRSGRPCRRCGTPISYRRQGPNARGTYWCPRCQV